MQRGLVGVDRRHEQQVLDETYQTIDVAVDRPERELPSVRVQRVAPIDQRVQVALDDGRRRAELVTDDRDEVGLHLVGLGLGRHVVEHEHPAQRAAAQRRDLTDRGVVHARLAAPERQLELLREVGVRSQHGLERAVAQTPGDGMAHLEGTGELEELRGRAVDHHETSVVVDDDDRVRHAVHDRRELLLLVTDAPVDVGRPEGERGVARERFARWFPRHRPPARDARPHLQ